MGKDNAEFGGYFELETFAGSLFHDQALALNTARNALGYVLEARGISRLLVPDYLCDSVTEACARFGTEVVKYPIGPDLRPLDPIALSDGAWLYIVNYFGQLTPSELRAYQELTPRLIVDNTQSFFTPPLDGIDTMYTCRKFLGVPDGAFLYTTSLLNRRLVHDESADSMEHVLGRFERPASDYYAAYRHSEQRLVGRPLACMSRLTSNLLRAVDYEQVAERRRENFAVLQDRLGDRNLLSPVADEGPYNYPLVLDNGAEVRPQLHKRGVFAPLLWPNVVTDPQAGESAVELARSLVPVPVDQRYSRTDMEIVADLVEEAIDAA